MRVTITARHVEIDEDLRAHAKELVERVAKLARRPHHAQVTFSDDHGDAVVEIELREPRGHLHIGKAVAPDHRSALDLAIARVKGQLSDEKEQPRPRRRASGQVPDAQ